MHGNRTREEHGRRLTSAFIATSRLLSKAATQRIEEPDCFSSPTKCTGVFIIEERNILHKSFIFNTKGKCSFETFFTARANTWLWQPIIGFSTFFELLGLILVLSVTINMISSYSRLIDSKARLIVTI